MSEGAFQSEKVFLSLRSAPEPFLLVRSVLLSIHEPLPTSLNFILPLFYNRNTALTEQTVNEFNTVALTTFGSGYIFCIGLHLKKLVLNLQKDKHI
jgi:hypothetical protein